MAVFAGRNSDHRTIHRCGCGRGHEMKRRVSRERSDSYLRLWLRLLKCTMLIEARVRGGLREEFESTLPRFDMLAQLDSAGGDGLTMGELSKRLMVTNGNLTGLTE